MLPATDYELLATCQVVEPFPPSWLALAPDHRNGTIRLDEQEDGLSVLQLAMRHQLPVNISSVGLEEGAHNCTLTIVTDADDASSRLRMIPFTLFVRLFVIGFLGHGLRITHSRWR